MRKQLRTLATLVAVVVSGLAVVAVAPAPPAAAWVTKLFTQGSLTVEPMQTNVGGCFDAATGARRPSSWLRRFQFGQQDLLGAFALDHVRFGVDRLRVATGRASVSVRVRVYRYPADKPLTLSELQNAFYAESTVDLAALPQDRLGVAAPRTPQGLLTLDPATDDAVVEVFYAGNKVGEDFTIGSNTQHSAPWYSYTCSPTMKEMETAFRPVIALQARDTGNLSDMDGDDIPDIPALDPCPHRAPGPYLPVVAGCPTIAQQVSASYDPVNEVVSGEVSISTPDGAHDGISCLDQVAVTLYDGDTLVPIGTSSTRQTGDARIFSWDAEGIKVGTQVSARVDQRLHTDPALGGLAICRAAFSQITTITGPDDDLDGVLDPQDRCDTRPGIPVTQGCPLVARQIPPLVVDVDNGVVWGVLKVVDPQALPEQDACSRASEVVLTLRGAHVCHHRLDAVGAVRTSRSG